MLNITQRHSPEFPFLTLPDPVTVGEGVLDPLGLALVGERLADWMLPGLTARMRRPRFLTAMAVSAIVCEGLEDVISHDGVTPASQVFEWLLVEGFARKLNREDTGRTPGIEKARSAIASEKPMNARAYLKTPSVFGFHGMYKRLARNLGLVGEDLGLRENGYALIRIWQREQQLDGFAEVRPARVRQSLREAVEGGLENGYTKRGAGWAGWDFFAKHLAPGKIGSEEAEFLRQLLLDPTAETRGEVFCLLEVLTRGLAEQSEVDLVRVMQPRVSEQLCLRLDAICASERFCACLEDAFDWLRYLSSQSGARALPRSKFAEHPDVQPISASLSAAFRAAEEAIAPAPPSVQRDFEDLRSFGGISTPGGLYDAILERHARVQKAKPPAGKREWFEYAPDGSVFVRVPYRLERPPAARDDWPRPYRLATVASFCADLRGGSRAQP